MSNQLAGPTPGIGHNEPPLAEIIAESLAPFLARRTALLDTAQHAVIVDDASAEKVINLSQMIRALETDLDARRTEMKAPHLLAGRTIDAEFGGAIRPLTTGRAGLVDMLNAHEAKKRRAADAARLAALAEQRRREEEAEALRRAAEAKTAAGKSGIGDELGAMAAQEAANAAQRRADAIRPEPVRAQLGSLGSRREIAHEIEDPRKLVLWMLKQPAIASMLENELRIITRKYLQQLGVDAVERGVAIPPGVKAWVDTNVVVRR